MIFLGGTPFGSPLVGWVGETFGARWMLIGGGAVSLLGIATGTAWYLRRKGPDIDELRAMARDLPWWNARRANIHSVQTH